MTGRPVLPPKMYALAVASLTDAALGMAEDKNVAVTVKQCVGFACAIVEVLDASTVYQLTECNPVAAGKAAAAINRLLDVCAASQVLRVLQGMDGFERLDQTKIIAEANAWVRDITANDAPGQRFRWPDPVEMAKTYFRARSSGPVSITFPNDRAVRAGYFLDRATAQVKTDNRGMTTPVLARCPAMRLHRQLSGKRVKETAQWLNSPAHYALTATLASLRKRLADQRATARTAAEAVAGVTLREEILSAVIDRAARSGPSSAEGAAS